MDLKCGKLIVNLLAVFVHLGIKVLRRILKLPHDAHTWLLGSLLKQNHSLLLGLYAFCFACKKP